MFFPRYCLCCRERLAVGEQWVCSGCLLHLPRIKTGSFTDNNITHIFWGLVPIYRGTSFFRYTKDSGYSRLLFALKYHGRPEVGAFLGEMMAGELLPTEFFDTIELLVPIPLSAEKERRRGYNQSLWIARGIAKATGIPIDAESVVRPVSNPSQTQLSNRQRRENVQNIFAVKCPQRLQGRHILLVDDVITTGATMLSCAETITAAAGHVHISVLSLALAGQA